MGRLVVRCLFVTLLAGLTGCAALARVPRMCIEQEAKITQATTTVTGLDMKTCLGPNK